MRPERHHILIFLLLSLFVHFVAGWQLRYWPAPLRIDQSAPYEVTYLEPEPQRKQFVTDHAVDELINELKEQTQLLSRLSKRVKEQQVAAQAGPTENRNSLNLQPEFRPEDSARNPPESASNPRAVGGMVPRQDQDSAPRLKAFKTDALSGAGPVASASTISEYIPNLKQGSFTALNTDQFQFYTFFHRINEQIRPRWTANVKRFIQQLDLAQLKALSQKDRVTQIEIILDRKGYYVQSIIHSSSGDPRLDQTSTAAFFDATPFLNPPQEMLESDGRIHLHYGFHIAFRDNGLAQSK